MVTVAVTIAVGVSVTVAVAKVVAVANGVGVRDAVAVPRAVAVAVCACAALTSKGDARVNKVAIHRIRERRIRGLKIHVDRAALLRP